MKNGDIIRVQCDLRAGRKRITYFRNGARIGPKAETYTLRLPEDRGREWYPVVSLYNKGTTCKVRYV